MSLDNQVAVITGGGRGIGLACARFLARDGAAVVLATPEDEERTIALGELQDAGYQALGTATDVTSEADLSQMVEETLDHFGRIDILVNNAGIIGPTAELQDVQRQEWEAVMNVNVTGMYLACRAVLPHLISRKTGRIINIASAAGQIGFPLRSPYAASKWAVIGLTKTLAIETAKNGILVNAVCPGPIDGPRMDAIIEAKSQVTNESTDVLRNRLEDETLLGRLIPAEHIAEMVAFLASDRADSITGQTLDVNAGCRV